MGGGANWEGSRSLVHRFLWTLTELGNHEGHLHQLTYGQDHFGAAV